MASRLELHEELCTLLGTRNVYFQPPDTLTMKYDAIRYSPIKLDVKRANNKMYHGVMGYQLITIERKPDSILFPKLLNHFSMITWERAYAKDNLNHNVYTLYY